MLDLSVVIPTRNRAPLLERVILGFLHQDTRKDRFEIVVADDGSTDETAEMLPGLSAPAPDRVRSIRLDHQGPAAARNRAIQEARGRLVLMVGDDTVPAPDLVASHVLAHRSHGDAPEVAVLGAAPFSDFAGRSTWMEQWLNRKHLGYVWLTPRGRLPFYHFLTSNISLKRSFLLETGGFDESFPAAAAEDIELGNRLEKGGMCLFFHPEAKARHIHPLTLSGYRRRMLKTGESLHTLKQLHPEVQALNPPGRRRFRSVWAWNPLKCAYFAFLYAWSVSWTLAGWRNATTRTSRPGNGRKGLVIPSDHKVLLRPPGKTEDNTTQTRR